MVYLWSSMVEIYSSNEKFVEERIFKRQNILDELKSRIKNGTSPKINEGLELGQITTLLNFYT